MKLDYKKNQSFLTRHKGSLLTLACVGLFAAVALDSTDLIAAKDDALRAPVEEVVGKIKGNGSRLVVATVALIGLGIAAVKASPTPLLLCLGSIVGYGGLNMYIDVAHAALV